MPAFYFIYEMKPTVSEVLLAEHVHIIGLSTRPLKNIDIFISLISFISLYFLIHFHCIYEVIFYITDCSFVEVLKVKVLKSN